MVGGGGVQLLTGSAPPAGPVVGICDLRVVRGGRVVIPALTLDVPRGQVVGLLGPSGCGKTTLMRCVVGVQVIAGGAVEVLGHPAGHPELRHRIGYLTQQPSVYPDLSVAENLRYFAAVLGMPRARRSAEVARVLQVVDLAAQPDSRVSRLSGGELCRVSLAAVLLGVPELLVLDEPTVGLDPVLRRDLWAMFHRLASDGVTLLVSSHVMDEASLCDRLLLLRDGEVLADETLNGLLSTTGAPDVEAAFLMLVETGATQSPPPDQPRSDPRARP